jgi:hypothetical protein
MNKGRQFKLIAIGVLVALMWMTGKASAAQCGSTAAGFEIWKRQFAGEAQARGVSAPGPSPRSWGLPIRLQLSRLTAVRGAFLCRLISSLQSAAAPPSSRVGEHSSNPMRRFSRQFSNVSASRRGRSWRFGEWRRVSGGRAEIRTSCRRSRLSPTIAVGRPISPSKLYAALTLMERGVLSAGTRGSMHGEVGHTQFLPKNILSYGIGGNLDTAANALSSTANFLKAHGWRAGTGYQPGEANFAALQAWNAAQVYQQAIAVIGRQIDGG